MPASRADPFAVHNQPAPPSGLDLWAGDAPLRAAIARTAPAHAKHLESFAAAIGTPEMVENGRLANRNPPELRSFDRTGTRIDEVAFHPAYHALMHEGISAGYAALPYTAAEPGGHAAHAAMVYLMSQVEPGVCCPMTMTYAAVPALSADASALIPKILSARYDPAFRPMAEKSGITIGMAMTEKQGGSDVRANLTYAEPAGDTYRLHGHKWFCSAPMSDAFLTLAQLPEGLTCFLVPRWTPEGTRNAIHLMRLKDKLGNRANASAEIEYHGAYATRLGAPGEGIRTILEMVHHTRLDTAIAPAGLMRRALAEAAWWARNRHAFGKTLIDQPLMQSVLADLALEWLGALAIALRTAQAFDTPEEHAFARLAVALAKYWNNKRCPAVIAEAMECLGGMGYVEDTPMPLLYREAPLNGIWEGSGNIICLDILRTLEKRPEAREALLAELDTATGASQAYDTALSALKDTLIRPIPEASARRLAERMALLLQSSLLLRHEPLAGEIFAATRLGNDWGHTFGTLPNGTDTARLAAMI